MNVAAMKSHELCNSCALTVAVSSLVLTGFFKVLTSNVL